MSKPWGIHWFRRDLRVSGNAALLENIKCTEGQVLGFFCFDSKFLGRKDFSSNRFAFFLDTLEALRKELRAQGGDLLVVDDMPDAAYAKLMRYFEKSSHEAPKFVSYNRDYEPYARKRDEHMDSEFKRLGLDVISDRDHLILEPHEVTKDGTSFYQIYSPYAKKWFKTIAEPAMQARLTTHRSTRSYFEKLDEGKFEKQFHLHWSKFAKDSKFPYADELESFAKKNAKDVTIKIPRAGFLAAFTHLNDFEERISAYKSARDIPSVAGTSQLSIFFKNGSLTTAQAFQILGLNRQTFGTEGGAGQYAKELVWREFYYSILFHRPDVEKKSFLSVYDDLPWETKKSTFDRWCEGTTGFPIVDAGMRQLNQTGWMHNRVRMIVASFLTKDLMIDYRMGENYFMKMLLDGDLAPNNGGWQWAASTGCDPQPYFRIFNPWLQGKKFDPQGEYIRHFIPELKDVNVKALHDPEADRSMKGYPEPMVDHSTQRDLAIRMYKKTRSA